MNFSQGGKRLLSALCCVWALSGCSPQSSSPARADLVFINGAEVTALDPVAVSDQVSGRVVTSLFEGLMRYNAQGRAEPGVSTEPDVSPDKKTYTFHLRPEATWTDGTKPLRRVTAQDFYSSWKRFLEPANGAEYANIFYCIKGAEDYNSGKTKDFATVGIAAPDEKTFVVELANPTPYFRDLVAFMCFCPVTVTDGPETTRLHFKPGQVVTNGPFILDDWKLNDHIRLRKNPHYWDAANVSLNTIDVLPISNASTALNLFLTGGADLLLDKGLIPPNLGEKLRQQPYFHYKQFLGSWFLRFNCKRAPFTDARVRRAFALAIDKERIVKSITQYGENTAHSIVPPGTGDNYQPPAGLKADLAEARKLMAEAGFPDGKGFPLVKYLFPNLSIEPNIAVELQSMWEKGLGVKVVLPKQEYKVYLGSQKNMDFDICRSSWIGDYNDPNTFLDMFTANSGNNRTGWANAAYDAQILAAAAEADPQKRYDIFRQAEDVLCNQETPIAPVYHYVGIQFYHEDKWEGIEANLTDEHPLRVIRKKAK
jgi:oligopeptide transport system substrate-binding protein